MSNNIDSASAESEPQPEVNATSSDAEAAQEQRHALAAFTETAFNDGVIDWQYWVGRMPTLTAAEAARLLCALDPNVFTNLDNVSNRAAASDACDTANRMLHLAERQGKGTSTPHEWLKWADDNGFQPHDGFRLAVDELAKATATATTLQAEADASSDSPKVATAESKSGSDAGMVGNSRPVGAMSEGRTDVPTVVHVHVGITVPVEVVANLAPADITPQSETGDKCNDSKPAPAESKPGSETNTQGRPRTIQTTTMKRSDELTAVIATAKNTAQNPDDFQSVWAELVKLAESENPPAPLIGFTDGEGVKYRSESGENGVKFFTKRNLSDRMRRARCSAK